MKNGLVIPNADASH